VILITGAASGIGRALAVMLDQLDARLALFDIDSRGLEQLAGDLNAKPILGVGDVSDRDQVASFLSMVKQRCGHLDMIINNAGVELSDKVETMTQSDAEWLFNINFWGVVHGTQLALPDMLKRNAGQIVNISSVFGLVGFPTQAAYCASKSAVKGFSESLQAELLESKVCVSLVFPGGVATNIAKSGRMNNTLTDALGAEEQRAMFDRALSLPAEKAAVQILKGMAKRSTHIYVGADSIIFRVLARWFPSKAPLLIAKFVRHKVKKALNR